jgi:hypothetical protein
MEQDLKRFFGQVNGLFVSCEQLLFGLQPEVLKNISFMEMIDHFPIRQEDFLIISYFLPDLGMSDGVVSSRSKNDAGRKMANLTTTPK